MCFLLSSLYFSYWGKNSAGSTATVALLHSLDEPRNPFFASEELHLILAHCGDTRALLCTVPEGTAVRLTETVSFPASFLLSSYQYSNFSTLLFPSLLGFFCVFMLIHSLYYRVMRLVASP